ncbi:MAG: CPBP family intramembrane metalloprotease [Bacillota bacterium]|nr:CPBP family intramembrane metalloprotease [Bacillota bacterium]
MKKESGKGLLLFLLLSFGLSWAITLLIQLGGGLSGWRSLLLSVCMLMPALSALLCKALYRLPWSDLALRPKFRGNWGCYLLACFGPTLLITAGAVLYFLLFPGDFDPTGNGMALFPGMLLFNLLFSAVLSPVANILFCAGEELGWRGFLLTRLLENGSPRRAMLLSGLIWGIWHGPMIAMGHNYGLDYPGWPWLGIFAMLLFCFSAGCLFSWLRMRTGSFWPAALAHGAMNGMASASALFVAPGAEISPFVGPLPTGIVGGCFFLLLGLLCFFLAPSEQVKAEES